jgi:hypothetical protein
MKSTFATPSRQARKEVNYTFSLANDNNWNNFPELNQTICLQ